MKERSLPLPGGCWKLSSIRLHQVQGGPMETAYDGRQVVGMDLHRRRSVLVRMTSVVAQGVPAYWMRCLGLDDSVAARPDGGAQGDGGAQQRRGEPQRQRRGVVKIAEVHQQSKSAQV